MKLSKHTFVGDKGDYYEIADGVPQRKEVEHLLAYLSASGCEFNRNGTWHDAKAATEHLQMKYAYLVRKDLVRTAEDFIRLGGTESSISHKPYKVRCGHQVESSGAWFAAELHRFRRAESRPVP